MPGTPMKIRAILLALLGVALVLPAAAQVYRCGKTEYTNRPPKGGDCKLLDSNNQNGSVTIVGPYTPPRSSTSSSGSSASTPGQPRVDPVKQDERDKDARMILENELKRAEARQAELMAVYKNGEPDKIGGEAQNYQKYLDRVAEMKDSIARNQADIDGIKRELERLAPKQ